MLFCFLNPQRLSLTSLSSPLPFVFTIKFKSVEAMICGNAAAEEDGGRVAAELEAAEALAGMGMARPSASRRPQLVVEAVVVSQDRLVAAEVQCGYAATKITTSEKFVEHIPTQFCSTSQQPPMKLRRKLTEAEKEERKLRHVMANRESARQTIRRRQAMHLDLTRRAADVLEENENLKKHKKLMMEDFSSIKKRNELLKARLAEVMKVSAREREEELRSTRAERVDSTNTTPPIFQPPSMVPCFWPSMLPSSDVFPSQCATHPHHITSTGGFPFQYATHPHHMMPSQYPIPPDEEHSVPTPFVVVPLPWLLPFLAHANASGTNATRSCEKCSCSDSRQSEDNNQSLYQNTRAEAYSQSNSRQTPAGIVVPGLFSPVRRPENLEPSRTFQVQDTAIPAHKLPDDLIVTTEARRRRKELMRLKNVNCK